tara:strand:- start:291 stop:515 length:225 start_codon:yes stop_codon:yes gene_type:complete
MTKKQLEKKYTLKQIIQYWKYCYGEDMKTEYSGFIKQLIQNKKTISKNIKQKKKYDKWLKTGNKDKTWWFDLKE